MKKLLSVLTILAIVVTIVGCDTNARVVSQNLSKDADMFQINRRVVFYNGITDQYMLVVEGFCSIEVDTTDNQLELTCKTGSNEYKKHFLGLSDNVTYFAEQIDAKNVSPTHYKVIFKPLSIIPDVDIVK